MQGYEKKDFRKEIMGPLLLPIHFFLKENVTYVKDMYSSVIQVRMDQGLVIKIRCPMMSW